jgi:hypothetical protein
VLRSIALGNSWGRYVITFTVPTAQNLPTAIGGDDAIFMQIGLPVGGSGISEINIAMPGSFLGDEVPTNFFQTYDSVNAVISSPRTGDYRTSLNSFQPYGWVAANDGTIGSAAASTTNRSNADTWPLYQLLWNNYPDDYAPVIGGRGANAFSDFSANKAMGLTRNLGRVMMGANPDFYPSITFNADAGTDILTLDAARAIVAGTPVSVENSGGALPSPLVANIPYFVSINSLTTTTVKLSTTLENAFAGVNINLTTNGTGMQTIRGANGAAVGASSQSLSIANMPSHNHSGSVMPFQSVNVGSGGIAVVETPGGVSGNYPLNIFSQGSGTAFSIFQPSVFNNVFIKL